MRTRWSDAAARKTRALSDDSQLGARVYSSRLLGAEPALVLHGGGNTSVKSVARDALGEPRAVLWIKGSGADLASIDERGFAPVDLEGARRLLALDRLTDLAMLAELRRLRLDPDAPTPSVETLLHALLPHRFVDHTHADAALTILLSRHGEREAREIWGRDHLIVPYIQPGFDLAGLVRRLWSTAGDATRTLRGLILLHHGVFTFGATARESYERMLESVTRAERRIAQKRRRPRGRKRLASSGVVADVAPRLARLRAEISRAAGRPMLLAVDGSREILGLLADDRVLDAAARGPLTPDHTLRTKPWPLLLTEIARLPEAVDAFAARYVDYFLRQAGRRPELALHPLDPAPRVVLAPGLGVVGAGESAAAARAAMELATHTLTAAATAARALGGYRPLPERALFEVEYWSLEQAKLAKRGARAPLAGRVALVTGAASGIGRAAAQALAQQGAAVASVDQRVIADAPGATSECFSIQADLTDARAIERSVESTVRRFGGLDILVSTIGWFAAGPRLEEMEPAFLERAFKINASSHAMLLAAATPYLREAPRGGSVVVVGTRNVAAPGPGAGAYSASKAALTQLARVAALELAADGIRVNLVHPDGVFDTGLWTPGILAERAARYGLTVAQYKRRNLLRQEVTSADVGAAIAALAGETFRATTGAQIPVDGGSDRVI